jgi:multidrug efflux pump subunit AcrA (membrane-fusion protein)
MRKFQAILEEYGIFGYQSVAKPILTTLITGEPILLVGEQGTGKTMLAEKLSIALGIKTKGEGKQFNASNMKLGKLSKKTFGDKIQTTGMIDVPPEYKAAVSSYFGGTVKDIHLLVGQSVKMGQTLFTLVNPEYVQIQQDLLKY